MLVVFYIDQEENSINGTMRVFLLEKGLEILYTVLIFYSFLINKGRY